MIVFDLRCLHGHHVFEAWFGSSADYEAQKQRGLLSCPICGDTDVDKAVMAPAVGAKGNQTRELMVESPTSVATGGGVQSAAPDPQAIKSILTTLAKAQAEALKSSTWVGTEFADTARAMHEGEIDQQPIHGQASPEETRSLIEEGIEIMPLPFPVRPPGMDN